ncbi:MAG: uroporphyrinogen-III C-methyltransferase, partial [Pseudomonadota bacterium]
PGLMTLTAAHGLAEADVVLHDSLVAPEILSMANPKARLESVGKRAGRPSPKQMSISERMIALAHRGLKVARLKGGDPFVFGRGGEEALALAAAGIAYRIVPGVTAGIGGLAYAGVPLTHRTLSQSVAFVTGHGAAGGLPRDVDWTGLARGAGTIVLYMGLRHLGEIAGRLVQAGRDSADPVLVLTDASTPHQSQQRLNLGEAATGAAEAREGASIIVIGPVVGLAEVLRPWQQTIPALVVDAVPSDARSSRIQL